jgi:hypothetical protein
MRSMQTTLSITPLAKLKSRLTILSESLRKQAESRPPTPVPPTPAMAVTAVTQRSIFIGIVPPNLVSVI